MKRRDFLSAASSIMIPALVGGYNVKAFGRHSTLVQSLSQTLALNNDRVLVIINLNGGNDGLNTVIPKEQYSLYNGLRSNIAIPENKILSLNGNNSVGLHPSMDKMKQLYDEKKISIINSVSYPDPSFSHFRASQIWMTGTEGTKNDDNGWAGRFLKANYNYPADPAVNSGHPLAIQIGYNSSVILNGSGSPMGLTMDNPDQFYGLVGDMSATSLTDYLPCNSTCEASDLIKYIRQQKVNSISYASKIQTHFNAGSNTNNVAYPGGIGDKLKVIARLLKGGLMAKIYFIEIGGFDTHNVQVINDATTPSLNNTTGLHADLLKELSDSIYAFQKDLEDDNGSGISNRVMGMTFSDFGRRATSNSGKGTDHGIAAPMFLFGSGAKKRMIGTAPVLTDAADGGDLGTLGDTKNINMQIDFRRVYNDILTGWFGEATGPADTILLKPGIPPSFQTLSIFTDEIETLKAGDWNDRTVWSSGRPPLTDEKVKINNGHRIKLTNDVIVKELRLNGELDTRNGTGKNIKITG